MPVFAYVVKDAKGQDRRGTQEAESVKALVTQFRAQGFTIINLQEARTGFLSPRAPSARGRKRVKLDDLVVFSRQMATMVDAGMPVLQCLEILREQVDHAGLQKVIGTMRDDVQGGKSFSEALAKHPKAFSSLFVNMVRAGEESGNLDEILLRLASYAEKTSALQKKIKSAMIYPAVVTMVAVGITTFMLTYVIPKFAGIFEQLGAPLPTPTRVLLSISDFLVHNGLYLLIGLVAAGIVFWRFTRTKVGRLWFHTVILRVWIFGPILMKAAVSKFSRTLSTLIRSGVPILTCFDIVGRTAGNARIEIMVNAVRQSLRQGETIASELGRQKLFPRMVVRMIAVGEETGALDEMAGKIADFYEMEVDTAVDGLSSLIEPLIILFLGVVVGGIVIALFLPILTMTQHIK